jgi:hypothetical protein
MSFGQADKTGAAQAKGPHSLPKSWLRCLLAGHIDWQRLASFDDEGRLQRFMLGRRSDRDSASFVLLCRVNTVDLAKAAATSGGGELDLDHLISSVVDGRSPTDTALSDRRQITCWRSQSMTNWLASIPCSVLACHLPSTRAGPMTSIPSCCWLLTGMGAVIEPEPSQVLMWSEVCLLKIGMDRFGHGFIRSSSSRGSHLGNEMRSIFLARLGDMHLIAGPPHLALFAVVGFSIRGRVDELFAWRKLLIAATVELALDPDVVLQPDAPQDLDRRPLKQKGGSLCRVEIGQQL